MANRALTFCNVCTVHERFLLPGLATPKKKGPTEPIWPTSDNPVAETQTGIRDRLQTRLKEQLRLEAEYDNSASATTYQERNLPSDA